MLYAFLSPRMDGFAFFFFAAKYIDKRNKNQVTSNKELVIAVTFCLLVSKFFFNFTIF